ncbi:MAG: glycoside hydrolase family 97 protein [Bacteroidota bacterium]
MSKSSLLIVLVLLTVCTASAICQETQTSLVSPDKNLVIGFQLGAGDQNAATAHQLFYTVSFRGRRLLQPSTLSLDIKGYNPLGADVRLVNTSTSAAEDDYSLTTGKTGKVSDPYHAVKLELEETTAPNRKLVIEARAYNDAVAFRYIVPAQETTVNGFLLRNENTRFHFSKDATTYALVLPHYRTMYESEYLKFSVSAFSNQGGVKSSVLTGLPLLAEVPGAGWLAIAEAGLQGYTSMYLTNPGGGWSGYSLVSRLSPRLDSSGLAVTGRGELHSAWRIIMVGDKPGRLLESNAIMNLSPAVTVSSTEWIKPGKASWGWWSGNLGADGKPAFTTANMKYYVDFSASAGLEYTLVDAGWSGNDITKMNGRVDIPELVKYAAARHVKVWIWLRAKAVDKQMEAAFSLYEKWGVAGVKIDFVERDDQEGIDFYYRTASSAAAHHLMVDFHGSTKPFGLERTYPNVMNYEAVLGMELSKGGTRDNPDNHVMLAFTRMLAGPMDFTPGGFNNVTREKFEARSNAPMVMGTRAHHLALYVVYLAPIEMVSDYPAAYEGQPAFEFIKKCPAAWDELKVLDGKPEEYISLARRKGRAWYIGSITGWQARKLAIPLNFLGTGKYQAEIYADAADAGQNPQHVLISRQTVTGKTILHASLASGGGYAVRLTPLPEGK